MFVSLCVYAVMCFLPLFSKGRPLYIKQFSNVGIVDAQQNVDINDNFKSFDEITTEYDLIPIIVALLNTLCLYLLCLIIGD